MRQRPAITIKDIANLLGMAHPTVSRALNDHPKISQETKARVKEAASRLGYVPNSGARSMRNGSSKLVGLIVPDVQNEFYAAAAQAMAGHCAELGYQMMLGVSEDDPLREEQHVRTLRESRCAGVLIVPSSKPTARTVSLLKDVATVQFLRHHKALGKVCVLADDAAGTAAATEHLLALGHTRIAFLGGSLEISTGARRVAGYAAALERHGITPDPLLQRVGQPRPDFGEEALDSLLQGPDVPTALVVGSSRLMLGVLLAARRRAVAIPADLAIVGYGDADWFRISEPTISAIALPVRAMTEHAAQALFERVAERPAPTKEPMFSTELVVRASSGEATRAARAERVAQID
jgi:LacI family transcriptional regulator